MLDQRGRNTITLALGQRKNFAKKIGQVVQNERSVDTPKHWGEKEKSDTSLKAQTILVLRAVSRAIAERETAGLIGASGRTRRENAPRRPRSK